MCFTGLASLIRKHQGKGRLWNSLEKLARLAGSQPLSELIQDLTSGPLRPYSSSPHPFENFSPRWCFDHSVEAMVLGERHYSSLADVSAVRRAIVIRQLQGGRVLVTPPIPCTFIMPNWDHIIAKVEVN